MLIFMLAFGLFTTIIVFNKPLTKLTKAKEESVPSSASSLIFAFPLTAPADGKYSVQVNIFVRNANNVPLSDKTVHLTTSIGAVQSNDIKTDNAGKAAFLISSSTSGKTRITALVDNQVNIDKNITVLFQ